jgi:hypothetical protein
MKTIRRAREYVIIINRASFPRFGGGGLQLKVWAAWNAVNRDDDFAMRA